MMQNKALTLSDGSEVCVSQHQIEILGDDESAAARRIEYARLVRSAVMSWAEQQCEMLAVPPRAASFYRHATAQQKKAAASWLVSYTVSQSQCAFNDPDLSALRSWALNDKSE